ncbi:indolepyruvate oxidoreductase subunit beta [Heliorestis acidaminivorans]|uniref:Indolepyruvate oxidoreductase subunit beta n=1 Tax=Heliorestis acidaminivorans TaxID=553427 RepID=A0A6I0EVX9_9FIRM|nr:indolepyruvate oxidoreductase subunit beta [Heliorestis acidaminivorans]KAB2951192.1 indolepyruvate oxidoreductase subunit beta [Heliorestis acidaminivorans]
MSGVLNILFVGVGGQGAILASKILSHVALSKGWDVKLSEIHGMAQRGGSVVTQVRMGEKVYSPTIEQGEVDIFVAFERLEAYRWAHMLREDGKAIVNDQAIAPLTVLIGAAKYPETILDDLTKCMKNLVIAPALDLAREAGNAKATNVVLMGLLAATMDIPLEKWIEALEAKVPAKLLEVNKKAFMAGYEFAQQQA